MYQHPLKTMPIATNVPVNQQEKPKSEKCLSSKLSAPTSSNEEEEKITSERAAKPCLPLPCNGAVSKPNPTQ
jgi:hypothetical protein